MIGLGIDIGGTGCKCVAFSDDGKQLAIAYTEYPLAVGQVNLSPDVLTSSVFQVIARCTARLENIHDIASVTISSFGESFVAVDELGTALSDILLYFSNTESEEFSRLVQKIGEEKFMKIARILPDASYSLSKMLYTRKVAERPVTAQHCPGKTSSGAVNLSPEYSRSCTSFSSRRSPFWFT